MPMAPFYTRFHDLAFEETRALVVREFRSLPPGEYGFLEFYCDEPNCDCRRVILQVERADTGERVWATINFGWEKPSYYREWMSDDAAAEEELAGATLDPLNPQSEHSQALLDLFREFALKDAAYVQRLKWHYELFKDCDRERSKTPVDRTFN